MASNLSFDDTRQLGRPDHMQFFDLPANFTRYTLGVFVFVQIYCHFDVQIDSFHLLCSDNS